MSRRFDELYGAAQEVIDAAKKPLIEKKVKRGFAAAIDSLESAKIDAQEAIEKARVEVANGNVEAIAAISEKNCEIAEIDLQITALTAEQEAMFAEVSK